MSKFGFQPTLPSPSVKLPEGYMPATVHLGKHSEVVFYSLEVWKTDQYVQHWVYAAQALRAGEAPVLFCTDYTQDGFSCFVGWPHSDRFVFEEWLLKHDAVVRTGLILRLLDDNAKPSVGFSHFPVEIADVAAITSTQA